MSEILEVALALVAILFFILLIYSWIKRQDFGETLAQIKDLIKGE